MTSPALPDTTEIAANARPLLCRGMTESALSQVTISLGLALSKLDPRHAEIERHKRSFRALSFGKGIDASEQLLSAYAANITTIS